MKKLLIIDSNSILNRAFYGIRTLTSKDGTPTNAVYGFLRILLKLIGDIKPDYICAAFDLKAPTFRHKMYDGYKAQRKPMPDDLRVQMPISKDILRAMNVMILEEEGYEADDIIGTVSRICEREGVECMIATGDKDDLQLATDKTKVILTVTRMGQNETVVYDDAAVKDKYGVTPTEFIDVKALMGDPSDNIPGVAGIGEKTALSLISKFSSIEFIYEHIDETGLKGAMLKKIRDGKDMAFLSKTLATIETNVPLDFDFSGCACDENSLFSDESGDLYSLLHSLSLSSIIKSMGLSAGEEHKIVSNVDVFEGTSITQIRDEEALSLFAAEALKNEEAACMFRFSEDALASATFVLGGKNAYYIDARYPLSSEKVINAIRPVLENEKINKITYDIKDALVRLRQYMRVRSIAYDAAIAVYLLLPERKSYEIAEVANDLLGTQLKSDKELSGGKNEQLTLFDDAAENGVEEEYARRALCIPELMRLTKKQLEENGQTELYEKIELPLVTVLADMQFEGFKVDGSQLEAFSEMLGKRIEVLVSEIYELAGEEFNINSTKQLGGILFEKLGLRAVKKTKTGYSTNAEVLEKLRSEHPIIDVILEYRKLAKLKSTYCDGLSAVINPKTGKIHSVFTQTVTVTGRISSTEPNMQNIPTRTELGREIRRMFVASGDNVLVDADYSQIELRVLAHMSGDETMKNAFLSGEDIHAVTAAQVLGIPISEVTADQRRSAKAVNFGIVYGIGEYSLSQDLDIPVREAKAYIDGYLEKYHGVREYMEHIKETAKADGYVKTMMNRIRHIPELKSSNYNVRAFGERVALNTPIQGTAADIIKLAMVRVHKRLHDEGLSAKLILQVHDELIIDTPPAEVEQVKALLREEMENAMDLCVPLAVDMSVGKSWYDAK